MIYIILFQFFPCVVPASAAVFSGRDTVKGKKPIAEMMHITKPDPFRNLFYGLVTVGKQ